MNKILIGILICIALIVIVFTVAPFGVDYDTVTNSYLNSGYKYGVEKSVMKLSVDTYKEIVDAKVEYFQEQIEAGNMTEDYQYKLEVPFQAVTEVTTKQGDIYISCDMGTYNPTDKHEYTVDGETKYSGYYSPDTAHKGVDFWPDGKSGASWNYDTKDFAKYAIVAPCDGVLEKAYDWATYHAIRLVTKDLTYMFYHCDTAEETLFGKEVKKGTVIAHMGTYGVKNSAHLHFTMYENGNTLTKYNPFSSGVWDMKGYLINAYNYYPASMQQTHATGVNGQALMTMSYLSHLRNTNGYQFRAGEGGDIVFQCKIDDETGDITELVFNEKLKNYLPICNNFEKDWLPEGVHR